MCCIVREAETAGLPRHGDAADRLDPEGARVERVDDAVVVGT
jgi:hypothetical protein